MPLPDYVKAASSGLPDYVKKVTGGFQSESEVRPVIPGESTSTLTGKPITEKEMLKKGVGEGQEMLANIPGSAADFGINLGKSIIHPVETVKGLGSAGLGLVEKAIPEEQSHEIYADAIGKFYKDRYGSPEEFKKTIVQDPVGVMADFASFLTAGGAAIRGVGALGKVAGISKGAGLAKVGETIQRAGAAIEPINAAKQMIIKPLSKAVPKGLPPYLYKQAVKFSSKIGEAEGTDLAQKALDYGLTPTSKGVKKANQLIGELDAKIEGIIKNIDSQGKRVSKKVLFKHIKDLKTEMGGVKLEGAKDLRIIDSVVKQFDEHLKNNVKKAYLTADDLQEFKKDVYRRVNYDRKTGKLTLPKERTAKAMARAAKEQLEEMHPEIKDVNAEYGPLRELYDEIEHRAAVIEKQEIMSFSVPVKAAAGQALMGPVGKYIGAGAGFLEFPKIKAKLALVLNDIRKYQPSTNLPLTASRLGLYTGEQINQIKRELPNAFEGEDGYMYVYKDGLKHRVEP